MSISMSPEYLMFYLPLIVAVSLVLAAVRFEKQELILQQSWRTGLWITGFMVIVSLLLWFASLWI